MKVWITQYALTKGIFEMNAEIVSGKYASGKHNKGRIFTRDWARVLTEALAAAENMRKARITSLQKSIAKLEKLKIKVTK